MRRRQGFVPLLAESGDQSEVLVDRGKQRLLIQGSDATQALAAQILETIDRPTPEQPDSQPRNERMVRGYPVPADELERIAAQLRNEYPRDTGVRVATDPRTRQLIIVGGADVHKEIQATPDGSRQVAASGTGGQTHPPARGGCISFVTGTLRRSSLRMA